MFELDLKEMLDAGVHFGHQTMRWNPKMASYIFGERNGVHIINLDVTLKSLNRAMEFIKFRVSQGDKILFVGTKKQAQELIYADAKRCNAFYVTRRWLGGTLTNFRTIRTSIERLKALEKMKNDYQSFGLTKKEVLQIQREIAKLKQNFNGIEEMKKPPSIMFVVDPNKEKNAVSEAKKLGMAIVGIVDTNCNPDDIDFVIPGNDDAIKSIKYFVTKIADAVFAGGEIFAREGKKTEELEYKLTSEKKTDEGKPESSNEKVIIRARKKSKSEEDDAQETI